MRANLRQGGCTVWCCILMLALSGLTMANTIGTQGYKGPYPIYPTPHYGNNSQQRTLIERGQYLVKVADCISCHTNSPEGGAAFAGGLPINTPFGVFYSPNITPDKETGIGGWSNQDFIRALHEGIAPDGSHYFPVFPYPSFTKVSTADAIAIKAYLDSIPAVHAPKRKDGVAFPFNVRFLQFGWKLLFFDKGHYKYDAEQSAEWNRGAYLVQGLGHCGECHTPRNPFGAVKKKYNLGGAFIDDFYAPNINQAGLANSTVEQIMQVFKGDLLNQAGPVQGPMAEVNHNSLRHLSAADQRAIVVYLKTVPYYGVDMEAQLKGQSVAVKGRKVYKAFCAECHTEGKAGAPMLGDAANWRLRRKQGMDALYKHTINGFNNMPIMGGCVSCSKEDVVAAVGYIIAHSDSNIGLRQNSRGQDAAALSLDDGAMIYQQHCASCHEQGTHGAMTLNDKAAWQQAVSDHGFDGLMNITIKGGRYHPPKGNCASCSTAELKVALKYILKQSGAGNYLLW